MDEQKPWVGFSLTFKKVLQLDSSPVGITCIKGSPADAGSEKVRICRAFLKAAEGEIIKLNRSNNACFGAAWHLGFQRLKENSKLMGLVKQFVVEGEKLFSSYAALDKLISQMEKQPDNSDSFFLLAPLEKCEQRPDIIIFVCNPEQTCRLLTLITFIDGVMPKIKIGGPTCRMALIYPLVTGEVNISFYDYTARKICNVEKDKLLVSIPYKRLPALIESIDKCSAGRAKIEYPKEFREFLSKRR